MSKTRYGLTQKDWDKAKKEITGILRKYASLRSMIPYGDLCDKLKSVHLQPDSLTLWALLGEISTEENAAGRGMLTVLVVRKNGSMDPGAGFFELARSIGHSFTDNDAFWLSELRKVWAANAPVTA